MINALRSAVVTRTQNHFFYGWAIVVVSALGIFTSGPGQSHTFSVFIGPISEDLGISNSMISTSYGIATLAAALLLPQTGRLVDRFGPRLSLIAITVLLGFACMFFGAAANFLWLAVAFALLRFFGQGSLMLGCANMVSQWFSRKRGFAMGLMALGFGLSMAVHPPLGKYLIDVVGWRQAWVILGLLTWVLMLPPLLFLAIDKPEDVGLRPDGARMVKSGEETGENEISGLDLKQAMATPAFYIISAGWFAIAMLVTTLHFWQVEVLTRDGGIAKDQAAQAFTISAIAMVAAMPLVGRLFDTLRTRFVFALALTITSASLVLITFAQDTATGLLYAVVFGLNNAFSMTMFGYIWPRYFGRKHLGAIQGTGQMIGVFGASLGPLPVGWAFDTFGDATWTLRLLAVIPLVIALLALVMLRTPQGVTEHQHLE